MMCIAMPYRSTSSAVIVLQAKPPISSERTDRYSNDRIDTTQDWWGMEDIEQLKEISAQGKPGFALMVIIANQDLSDIPYSVEIGLAHAHLLEEAERGRKLADANLSLQHAKAAAEAASMAKSQFLAVVSHEIR